MNNLLIDFNILIPVDRAGHSIDVLKAERCYGR